MQPNEITAEDKAYWADYLHHEVTFTAPDDPPDCVPCPALVTETEDGPVVRVLWTLTKEERYAVSGGADLWLSTWGGLPPHSIEVQA